MAKLLVQESTGVREFELVDAEIHIGRELDNALRLSDPSISRHHAILRQLGDTYELQDLQSSNGVLVNGTRVQSSPLQDGDRLTLGQVQMTFLNPQPTAALGINPLGTVRLSTVDVAKLQATPGGVPAHLEVTPPADMPAVPPPVPPPAPAPIGLVEPPAAAPKPPPVVPRPDPVPTSFTAHAANPAPGFLRPFLPSIPDEAIPTGERGDFVTRLLAHLLDAVIFAVPIIALWIVSFILIAVLAKVIGAGVAALGCLFGLIYIALCVGYIIFIPWCWIKFGATPGKKIMKLRVVPEDNPNGRIDVGAAILRIVGHWVNGIFFSLPYLMILGSERKGLQDIFSKSIVIKVDR